jgi:thiamine kinase-like enzyme
VLAGCLVSGLMVGPVWGLSWEVSTLTEGGEGRCPSRLLTHPSPSMGQVLALTSLQAARIQMEVSLGFDIVFAALGVGLPLLLLIAEYKANRAGDTTWMALARAGPFALPLVQDLRTRTLPRAVRPVTHTVLAFAAVAIDASADPALDAAIRAIPGWEGSDLVVEPIAEGRTNRNFRVTIGGESYFLRLSDEQTSLLGIDRDTERASIRAAAEAGHAPEVVEYLPALRCLVTRWVDADPLAEGDLERDEVLAPAVEAVRAIHAGPRLDWAFDPFRIVEDYSRIAEERGVAVPDDFDPAHAMAARIEGAFALDSMPARPCHNDLLEANFLLRDGHVWIVDHEYAGMGDPFFDLGNLSINNALSDAAQERLLVFYFGDVTDSHRSRLKLMRIMSDFREAMWGVVQQGLSTLDIDYAEYAQKHFDRLSTTMADERFEDWLDTARGSLRA